MTNQRVTTIAYIESEPLESEVSIEALTKIYVTEMKVIYHYLL